MQVSDATQLVSSATIGNVVVHEMGISDDPAFYQILSANLYANQKLAMVRETICNAWDAHIEADKQDTPIMIAIDENNMLTIADSGMGIPDDLIVPIYGVYGASTKKSNSATTGGFGLGCKSPLAYTDSFQVISEHQGVRTIYNVTKSSTETNGRPGIIKVVSMPTTESGIAVKIALDAYDVKEVIEYVKSIVFNGEIKASLHVTSPSTNWEDIALLPVMGMSFAAGSYDVSSGWWKRYMGHHAVFVRYGNVIYPALDTPATHKAIRLLEKFLKHINCGDIVIQAAPDTLALSPSRETLSSQQLTEDSIVNLCTDLVERIEIDILAKLPKCIEQVKDDIRKSEDYRLGSYLHWITSVQDKSVRGYLTNNCGVKYFKHYSGQIRAVEREAHLAYLNLPKEVTNSLRKVLRKFKSGKGTADKRRLYRQYVVKPLSRVIANSKGALAYNNGAWRVCAELRNAMLHTLDCSLLNLTNSLTPLTITRTKRVFVTQVKNCSCSIQDYLYSHSISHELRASLVYRAGRKKGEAQAAIHALREAGYDVIDLTVVHDWDRPAKERKRIADERKYDRQLSKPAKGVVKPRFNTHALYSLRCVIPNGYVCKSNIKSENPDITYVEPAKPLFYIHIDNISDYGKDPLLTQFQRVSMLTDEELDNGVVIYNGHQLNKVKKLKLMPADVYFRIKLAKEMCSPEMVNYLTKERQLWLPDLDISAKHLRIAEILGIKLPFLKNLRFDSRLEKVLHVMRNAPAFASLFETEPHWKAAHEMVQLRPVFESKIKPLVQLFGRASGSRVLWAISARDLLEELRKYPECRNAYRTIITSALKRVEEFNRAK